MNKPVRILLVDEYEVMRDALRALITTTPDMEVVGDVADSEAAVEQASLLLPDVIIIDLSTPSGDGMIVVESLLDILPQPRILVLTNDIDKKEISAAIDAGVMGYLIKGTAAPEILQAIRAIHQGESIFDPAITNKLS